VNPETQQLIAKYKRDVKSIYAFYIIWAVLVIGIFGLTQRIAIGPVYGQLTMSVFYFSPIVILHIVRLSVLMYRINKGSQQAAPIAYIKHELENYPLQLKKLSAIFQIFSLLLLIVSLVVALSTRSTIAIGFIGLTIQCFLVTAAVLTEQYYAINFYRELKP